MTIAEAIARLDNLKFNTYSQEQKISWLSELDGRIKLKIIDTHEGHEQISFSGYNQDTPKDTVLLVGSPFEDIYLRWMEAQVDYCNKEFDLYNSSITMFNAALTQLENHYNMHHMPLSRGRRFLF
jgi:hypothetical protein